MVGLATSGDQFFEEYREGLLRETQRLAKAIAILRLLDESRSDEVRLRGLNGAEQHLDVFSAERHQARRNLASDYWLLGQLREDPVTSATVDSHREQIKALAILASTHTRRDKFWVHSDKKYVAASSRLQEDAPISWSGLDASLAVAKNILHTYSGAFDGPVDTLEYMNVRDLELLLDRVPAGQPAETSRTGNVGGRVSQIGPRRGSPGDAATATGEWR